MADVLDQIVRFISNIIFVPAAWLEWPQIVYMLIVPIVLIWYAIKKLLETVGIFRGSSGINAVIAAIVSLFLLPVARVASFGAAGFIALSIHGWKKKIGFLVLYGIYISVIIPKLALIKI